MIDIYRELPRQMGHAITVDFLTGRANRAKLSPRLRKQIALYKDGFARLCKKHNALPEMYVEASARFYMDRKGYRFSVTVEDRAGRRQTDEYIGMPGRRVRILDQYGRVRRK
ncbi:hypothetical protein FF098_016020 [Parvularcula flava]|uniref:Uncharacterized protein n=1 Tax=Aquisalinus luteolus TaxID=1566827 RepID=A0A8J3EQF7_9PROT|nr:hypothetical protein [Aquisalinus luteolus]NHK29420.1 hypothetical protein [Aquisalinus luteolus]GGI02002.1 hypothetical protein GCM10011355_33980 [Aquisalinus luteolus]